MFKGSPPPLLSKIIWGIFQNLKSSLLCTYLSVPAVAHRAFQPEGVLVPIKISWTRSSSKLSRPLWHFDMSFSRTKLERTGSGYKCVWQFTFTQIHHYHQCLNGGMAVRRPLGVKWAIKRAESHCSSTTIIGGAAFHENLTWSVSIPFFPGEKCP